MVCLCFCVVRHLFCNQPLQLLYVECDYSSVASVATIAIYILLGCLNFVHILANTLHNASPLPTQLQQTIPNNTI